MKPSWKGSLSFGLVDIRLELFSAIRTHAVNFHLLHTKCHTPIIYQRWCTHCKKEVAWHDIEKGLALKDGTFFILTPANLKKLKPKRSDTISIVEFVDTDAIDPVLYDGHYYVLPSKDEVYPFLLFATALARLHKIAIGQFVLRDKEYVCAIRPYQNFLLLTTLHYAYEINLMPTISSSKKSKINTKELHLAEQLIDALTKKSFSIKHFKDSFITELLKKIKKIKKGLPIPEKKMKKRLTQSSSLAAALQNSLSSVKKTRR